MKYIRAFENSEEIEYKVGDVVACIDPEFDEIGKKYTIIEIYTYSRVNDIDDLPDKIDLDYITSDEVLKHGYFVTIENISKNNTHHGIYARRFRSLENAEAIISSNKYNL